MRSVGWFVLAVTVVAGAAACREGDGPIGPVRGGARMFVSSSPQGARILLDGRDTGARTPDTIAGLAGSHTLVVRLDTLGYRYEYNTQFTVTRTDTVFESHAPVLLVCPPAGITACHGQLHRYHEAAGMRFASSPLGSLFLRQGQGQGLFWPASTTNSYVSGAMPVVAMKAPAGTVSLGIYDHIYLAGRPAPEVSTAGGEFRLRQQSWVLPPSAALLRAPTIRGLSISQQVIASSEATGTVLIRLTFRNITGDAEYRLFDRFVGSGMTFTDTFVGLALDPDIGVADDDWLSYDPQLDMVFAYDARFTESAFTSGAATAPGLVGLRALRAPAGSTVILNGWTGASADWRAGEVSESRGHDVLSGLAPYAPAHADRRVGHLPPAEGDVRLAVTAGPLTLEPGDEAEIVLALVLAPPAAGSYQAGVVVQPGDPFNVNRELYRIAAPLRARALEAESLLAGLER